MQILRLRLERSDMMNIKNVLCGLLVVLLIVIGGTLIYMDNVKSGSKQQVNSKRENIRNYKKAKKIL